MQKQVTIIGNWHCWGGHGVLFKPEPDLNVDL